MAHWWVAAVLFAGFNTKPAVCSTKVLAADPWAHHRPTPIPNYFSDSAGMASVKGVRLKAIPNSILTEDFEYENVTSVEGQPESNMIDAVKFMKKFGYVPAGDSTADFIFSAESLKEKLRLVQKFGNIPETGELDKATLELMASPRCGVPDITAEEGKDRKKRYIVGSSGWSKRRLTYTVANWSPKLISKETVQRELKKAFDAWSQYSRLQFTEVATNDADIIIFFAQYSHYDNYPFDGQGGILAHAYYPYEFGSYGGDVHFDESEEWTINPEDEYSGLDFFTVAVHEIGHSLGLSHSPVASSIMFPYYKGVDSNFHLDYDDVMGMWELYIRRKLDGDDEYFNTTTTTSTSTPIYDGTQNDGSDPAGSGDRNHGNDDDKDDRYHGDDDVSYQGDSESVDDHKNRVNETSKPVLPTLPPLLPEGDEEDFYEEDRRRRAEEESRREEERRRMEEEEAERRRWAEERRRQEEETRRREEEERRRWEEEEDRRRREWETGSTTAAAPSTATPVPDICRGSVDSVAVLRDELFIFKGKYMWRYHSKGHVLPGYPSLIQNMFYDLPTWIQKIDAAYERRNDSNIVFFVGKYYYVHDGNKLAGGSPRPITDYGLPETITQIDAAFYWPKNERTYLFRRNLYWRRNDYNDTGDDNYPRDISRWNGVPKDIDAAVTYTNGISYFFKDDLVWQYDNRNVRPTSDSPRNSLPSWTGC